MTLTAGKMIALIVALAALALLIDWYFEPSLFETARIKKKDKENNKNNKNKKTKKRKKGKNQTGMKRGEMTYFGKKKNEGAGKGACNSNKLRDGRSIAMPYAQFIKHAGKKVILEGPIGPYGDKDNKTIIGTVDSLCNDRDSGDEGGCRSVDFYVGNKDTSTGSKYDRHGIKYKILDEYDPDSACNPANGFDMKEFIKWNKGKKFS